MIYLVILKIKEEQLNYVKDFSMKEMLDILLKQEILCKFCKYPLDVIDEVHYLLYDYIIYNLIIRT
jgi:hypothetical protein